jgi:hypothetical protein
LSASTLDYTVAANTCDEFTDALTVSDELNAMNSMKAVTWTATTDAPWRTLSNEAGSSAPNQQLQVSLDSASLSVLPSGAYSTNITFNYQDSVGSALTAEVPVSLNVRMPLVRAATGPGNTKVFRSVSLREGFNIADFDSMNYGYVLMDRSSNGTLLQFTMTWMTVAD